MPPSIPPGRALNKPFCLHTGAAAALLAVLALVSAGCRGAVSPPPAVTIPPTSEEADNSETAPEMEAPGDGPEPTLEAPEAPYSFSIDPQFPSGLQSQILSQNDLLKPASDPTSAQIHFRFDSGGSAGGWFYAAAAAIYTQIDAVSSADLEACWRGGSFSSGDFSQLLVSDETLQVFSELWGEPDPGCLRVLPGEELGPELWLQTGSLALIPFEGIIPGIKVLAVDGADLLAPDFQPAEYALQAAISVEADPSILTDLDQAFPFTNFSPSQLTSLALTGVTALVRDTAVIMEEEGLTYPAGDIKDILTSADIAHINNEVPFAEDCPPPKSSQNSLLFCSDDRYLELLRAVGTDIVELSGDHFGDWGKEAMLHTIKLYQNEGWLMYGGGKNLSQGLAPVLLEHNSNHLAFIGCNGKGLDRYATATELDPGAARCDFDWMVAEIERLSSEGYLVIATMQHEEVDSFYSIAWQRDDFRRLADAGAVIVSGSQAHHPQAFEFSDSSFIHYGLGNLFFDQYYLSQYFPEEHLNKDKAFIDLHYFYAGEYINTRLIPLQFIDNARPRPMTPEESEDFLPQVYKYSLWGDQWVHLFASGYYAERK